jgi:hypothetical protein
MKYLLIITLCTLGTAGQAYVSEAPHTHDREVMATKCPVFGCFGFVNKSFEFDWRGDVYRCSEGHKFIISR